MTNITQKIKDPLGLHARLASRVIEVAKKYPCKVRVCFGGSAADAQDLLQLMGLDVRQGDQVRVEAQGADEEAAAQEVAQALGEKG